MSQYRWGWLAALGWAVTLGPGGGIAAASEPPRPNLVYILADDLGYGDLGCYGQTNFDTPNLDRMASEGMRFTQHYAGSTVCAPSRACLLSGQHSGHIYQRANGGLQFREDPQDRCVASILKDAGYHTAMIGKSGLSCNSDDGGLPNRKGFDYFFGFTSHARAHRYYPGFLWRNGEKVALAGNRLMSGEQYSGELFLNETREYLVERSEQDQPFFLHVSLQQPHADLNVPEEWKQPFVGKFNEQPARGGHYRSERHPKSTYAGMVSYLDHTVGEILDQLEALGLAENTLVLFASDNGAMSEGGWSRRYFDSSGPLRGGKRDLYEGGIRVPLIAWWPGKVEAGLVSDHVSAFWDFVPTACELAGAETPAGLDGVSMVPTLAQSGPQAEHEYLYWEFHERGGKQAVRCGDWKAVRLGVDQDLAGPLELYDLKADLSETTDLAAEHPEVTARMSELMRLAHVPGEAVRFDGEAAPIAAAQQAAPRVAQNDEATANDSAYRRVIGKKTE